MKLLSFEIHWMELWFKALLPHQNDTFLTGVDTLPLDAYIRDYFSHTPEGSSIGVRLASFVLAFLCFFRFFKPLSKLTREERGAYLTRVSTSNVYLLRELPMLLKITAFMAWDAQESVHRQLGVIGPMGPPAVWLESGERS